MDCAQHNTGISNFAAKIWTGIDRSKIEATNMKLTMT